MSVELAAMTVPAPCQATARGPSPLVRLGRGGEQGPERDWLDLFAEVTRHPPPTLPCERIARLLCATFEATACSYASVVGDGVVGGMIWSDGGSSAPRAPETAAVGALVVAAWEDLPPALRCPNRLSLPASAASSGALAFVVGRHSPFRSTDRQLAATLWTLLLDHHARYGAASRPKPPSAESSSLTARELAVLALLGEGLTAAAIARRLQISVRTVHKHLERIYAKLEVTDRLAAVLAARRLGVVPLRLIGGGRLKA